MKKIKKWISAGFLALTVCAMITGVLLVNAADYETEAFFSATGGMLTVTENYDAGATGGAKLELSQTGDSATIYYNDAIPVGQLGSAITFQVLPSADAALDFNAVQVILRDSEDPSQLISVVVEKSATWDTSNTKADEHTAGFVSLEENLARVDEDYVGGSVKEGMFKLAANQDQFVYSLANFATNGYSMHGTLNLGTWNTIYPLLAAENKTQTQPITVSYSGSSVSVNGVTVADLKNDDYQSLSTESLDATADAAIIAKYNDDYVDGLFSSGKVKAELKFLGIKNGSVAVNIANIGNVSFSTTYENNFTSTVETDYSTQATAEVTGTKFALSGKTIVLGKISTSQLENAVEFQMLPESGLGAEAIVVTLRDSQNASQSLSAVIVRAIWYGTQRTAGMATLQEGFTYTDDGFCHLTANDSQALIGFDNFIGETDIPGGYSSNGTVNLAQWGTWYPLLGAAEGRYTQSIKVGYKIPDAEHSELFVNDIFIADLKKDTFQEKSTENLDPVENAEIIAKYTDEYVDGLFSSGEVIVELSFKGTPNGSVNVISLGGQSAANLQIDYSAPQDTLAPEITAIAGDTYNAENKTFTVHPDTAYTVSELAQITASDLLDPAPVTGIEAYSAEGTKYETEQVTFAEGDYVILFAEDADGNRTEVRAEISFLPEYTITYTDKSGTDATVVQGDEYTFAAPAAREGEVFAGWQIGGKLYPADYKITVTENIEVSALFISFATDEAEMAGENAIRYFTRVDSEDYTALESAAKELQFGTVITCDSKAGHLDIETKVWVSEGAAEGCEEYRAVFTDIPEEMFDAIFTATGYVIVTYENGATASVMAEGIEASVNELVAEV